MLTYDKINGAIASLSLHPLCRRLTSRFYLAFIAAQFIIRYIIYYSIPYTAIQSATSQRRMFHLIYLSLDGEETSLDFKLDSSQSASGLYRAITEKHAFYSCETVRSAVTAQFIRDLKVPSRSNQILYIFHLDYSSRFISFTPVFFPFDATLVPKPFYLLNPNDGITGRPLLSSRGQ